MLKEYYRKSKRLKSHCLLSTLPMSTPIIFLVWRFLRRHHPRVRIIANSAVVDRINKVYKQKIDKWKTVLGSGATSQVVAIEKFDGNFIRFESSKIEVLKNIQGDTDENTMLWIPGQRILITGDVLFNNM